MKKRLISLNWNIKNIFNRKIFDKEPYRNFLFYGITILHYNYIIEQNFPIENLVYKYYKKFREK